MDRFIPREKLGKKARKALDRQRRATWSFSPTTRKVESKKRYNRKACEREERDIVGFCFSEAFYEILLCLIFTIHPWMRFRVMSIVSLLSTGYMPAPSFGYRQMLNDSAFFTRINKPKQQVECKSFLFLKTAKCASRLVLGYPNHAQA